MSIKMVNFYELVKSICRQSSHAKTFLNLLNTSSNYDMNLVLHVLKDVIVNCGDKVELYKDCLDKQLQFMVANPAEVIILVKIFNNDYKEEKKKLIFETQIHRERDITLSFLDCRSIAEHMALFVFTPDRIKKVGDRTYYIKSRYRWKETVITKGSNMLLDKYSKYFMYQDFKIVNGDRETKMNTPANWKVAYEACKLLIENDDNFLNRLYDECKGKVYFKNGYYDFKTKEFVSGNHNTMVHLNFDYNIKVDKEAREKIFTDILDPFFTILEDCPNRDVRIQYRDLFLNRMCLALSGLGSNKEPIFYIGERNGGKGAITKLLLGAFGDQNGYAQVFDLTTLRVNPNEDILRFMSSWSEFQFRRLAISNESPEKNNQCVLDGNKLKKIFSGEDKIQYRKLYHEPQTAVVNATMLGFMNKSPLINIADAEEKIIKMDLNTIYYDDERTKKERTGFHYIKVDKEKGAYCQDPKVHEEFIRIIMENFETNIAIPQDVIDERDEEMVDITEVIREKFDNIYARTGSDEGYFLSYEDINNIINKDEKINAKRLVNLFKDAFGKDNVSPNKDRMKQKRGIWGISVNENQEF